MLPVDSKSCASFLVNVKAGCQKFHLKPGTGKYHWLLLTLSLSTLLINDAIPPFHFDQF